MPSHTKSLLGALTLLSMLCASQYGCGHQRLSGPDVVAPSPITSFSATIRGSDTALLTWIAPGDDGVIGTASAYEIRHSMTIISSATYALADTIGTPVTPAGSGTQQQQLVIGLHGGSPQYFAIRASDERGNWSSINVIGPFFMAPDTLAPASVVDLHIVGDPNTSIGLAWTATGDDGNRGRAERYEVRYLAGNLTSSNWDRAHTPNVTGSEQGPPGTHQVATIEGSTPRIVIQYAVRVADESGNWSSLSNVISASIPGKPKLWIIRPDLTGLAPTIQSGIDSSLAGDTVRVEAGTYYERLVLRGKDICIRSTSGPEVTIIDAGRSDPGPVIVATMGETQATLIQGFTLTGGSGYGARDPARRDGGGIYASESFPTIRGNRIMYNSCTGSAGGVYLRAASLSGSKVYFIDNVVERNTSAFNSGGAVIDADDVSITGNTFANNVCTYDGGGVQAGTGTGRVLIEGNQFLSNQAGDHAGGLLVGGGGTSSFVTLRYNVFYRNHALGGDSDDTGAGGAVMMIDTDGELTNNTFIENIAGGVSGCPGGAVLFQNIPRLVRLENNIFEGNKDCTFGCRFKVTASFGRNLFWHNVGDSTTAAPHVCSADWFKGALIGDPLFCDPEGLDFRVRSTSPAVIGEEVLGAVNEVGCGSTFLRMTKRMSHHRGHKVVSDR